MSEYLYWKIKGDSLVLALIEGEVCAKATRGRRKFEWVDNIRSWRNEMKTQED